MLPDGRPAWCDGGPLRHPDDLGSGPGAPAVLHRLGLESGLAAAARAECRRRVGRRPGRRPAGRGHPPRRSGAHHRPGGLGQDPGAHRAGPAAARRLGPATPARSASSPSTGGRPRRWSSGPRTSPACTCARSTRSAWPSSTAARRSGAATGGRHEVLDERAVRRLLDGLVTIPRSRRRVNTDPIAAWLEALSAVPARPARPQRRRGRPRRRGRRPRRRARALPDRPRRAPASSTSTSRSSGAIEVLLAEPETRGGRAGRLPAAAGRRVPGPHPRPRAADPAAGAPRPGRLRRGRRRPDDLRLHRRHARLADRLRRAVPRCRRTTPWR